MSVPDTWDAAHMQVELAQRHLLTNCVCQHTPVSCKRDAAILCPGVWKEGTYNTGVLTADKVDPDFKLEGIMPFARVQLWF